MHHDSMLIAPSILSADILKLGEELDTIKDADFIHVDVMDGSYVPNLTFGPNVVAACKRATDKPVDVHLMIENPDETVERYLDAGADLVSVHVEVAKHSQRLVSQIKAAGAKASVSINPGTSIAMLDSIIEFVDMVLVMTVNPGFGGQSFIPQSIQKIRDIVALCDAKGVNPLIEVDGGIGAENIAEVARAGANVFVAGSHVFGKPDRAAAIHELRTLATEAVG